MDTTPSSMTNLFLQLGLPAGKDEKRQFLREEWGEDADWAIVVDALNEALHADAIAARAG